MTPLTLSALLRKKRAALRMPFKNGSHVRKLREGKQRGRWSGPAGTTPQLLVMIGYFFFEDFLLLLLAFFEDLPPFLDAAILLTTFHAVRDLAVALLGRSCRIASGSLIAWD